MNSDAEKYVERQFGEEDRGGAESQHSVARRALLESGAPRGYVGRVAIDGSINDSKPEIWESG